MSDLDAFETRVAAAYRRYVGQVPVDVDAMAIAESIASAAGRPRLRLLTRGPRLASALLWLVAVALLATLAAGAAFVASRPTVMPRHPQVLVPTGVAVPTPDTTGFVSMAGDASGTLWAKSLQSLVRFDPATGTARTWTAADDAAFAQVNGLGILFGDRRTVFAARGGGVWLIGDRTLRWFDGELFRDVVEAPEHISRLAEAPDGSLWVVTEGDDLLRWDGTSWEDLVVPRPSHDIGIDTIAVGADGRLWVGGPEWIKSFDGSTWTTVSAVPPASIGDVAAIAPLPDGNAWVVSSAGIGQVDGSIWTSIAPATWTELSPTVEHWPNMAWRGPDGDLWVGGGGGHIGWDSFVGRFDGRSWTMYTRVDGLPGGAGQLVITGNGTYMLAQEGIYGLIGGRWTEVWPTASPGSLPSAVGG